VVITVPAWFTQAQRGDTKAAGEAAGFVVERIINEPTAAALAHAHGQDLQRRVLVYDLGGGTFDVSLVRQDGPVVEVEASHGDSTLGGDDIDDGLVQEVLNRLTLDDPALGEAIQGFPPAQVRLRMAVERAKVELSSAITAEVRVPFLLRLDGVDRHLDISLTRDDLEAVSAPLLMRTLKSVQKVLDDVECDPSEVDELLLVGGATLQPAVWHLLKRQFGLEGSHAIDARRAVVLGAAIQGAIVDGSTVDGILIDVAPYALSAGVLAGNFGEFYVCQVITPRNTSLPGRHTQVFSTNHDRQREVRVVVFQGSHADPRLNSVLGVVVLKRLPRAPVGMTSRPIQVEYRHNLDGMVDITVTDVLAGRSSKGRVASDGDEQEALRAEVAHAWERPGCTPGDGSSDDERLISEQPDDDAGMYEADVAEMTDLFSVVLAQEDELATSHAESVQMLVDLARKGMSEVTQENTGDALQVYEDLIDKLLDLGLYL